MFGRTGIHNEQLINVELINDTEDCFSLINFDPIFELY